jgi:hypothetical protein
MESVEDYVKRLSTMSPRELEAERQRAKARTDAAINRLPEPEMTRADSGNDLRMVERLDDSGRKIREWTGTSMRSWMGQFMSPGQKQIRIWNCDSTPKERAAYAKWLNEGGTQNYAEWRGE